MNKASVTSVGGHVADTHRHEYVIVICVASIDVEVRTSRSISFFVFFFEVFLYTQKRESFDHRAVCPAIRNFFVGLFNGLKKNITNKPIVSPGL